MNTRIKSFAAGASLLLLCTASTVALADGMPYGFIQPPAPHIIPDTPDNTGAVNTTDTVRERVSGTAQAQTQLPKPLPPQPRGSVIEVQPNTSFFGLSVGEYDPFRHGDRATSFNAELQPGLRVLGVLQPLFGAMATTKGSAMAYAGLGVPFHITRHVFLMPSVGLGIYRAGGGYDLNRTFVGRFGAELAYQFDNKSRLGLNFDVITNGRSTAARDRTEMLALTYTQPFNLFSGESRNDMAAPQTYNAPVQQAAPAQAEPTAPVTTQTITPADLAPAQASAPTALAPAPAPAAAPAKTSPSNSSAFPDAVPSSLTPAEENTNAFP